MNIKESFVKRIDQESGPKIAGKVVFVDFEARIIRSTIVGIYGMIPTVELIQNLGLSNIIKFPKKQRSYNPREKSAKVFDRQGRLVRVRRASRCDGSHDAKENPCGSPRCRTRHRQNLKVQSANPENKKAKSPTILRAVRSFKRVA